MINILGLIVLPIAFLALAYFAIRWILSIDIVLKQNESIVNVLMLLAKKTGATDEEINSVIN